MRFMWLSEQTVPSALHIINRLVFITEVESVYCAVRVDSFITRLRFVLKGLTVLRIKHISRF